jgi:hypothetical protein
MKYVVDWAPAADRDLTELWLRSRMQYAVTRAADSIDDELTLRPHEFGESRENDKRVGFVWPLGVSYEVNEPAKKVRVLSVWQI